MWDFYINEHFTTFSLFAKQIHRKMKSGKALELSVWCLWGLEGQCFTSMSQTDGKMYNHCKLQDILLL